MELAKAVGPAGAVFGVELSDEMVRLTGKLLREEGLAARVALFCGDAAELPFQAQSLNAIFTSFTLELFDTPEIPTVLAECRRVLERVDALW
ncbi:MAG TPA: class I SAM-dependent methyltransferase [Vicinamibacteria bacterium]|nr:class I SAM-dependent methyltransferase [Vicinamibacteria bacterium]